MPAPFGPRAHAHALVRCHRPTRASGAPHGHMLRPARARLLGTLLAAWGLSAGATPPAAGPSTAPPLSATASPVEAGLTPPLPTLPLPQVLRDGLQAAGIPASAVSLLVLPLGTPGADNGGEGAGPRLSHLADQSRPVASVMKLFTTGAALLARGPASTWHTDTGLQGPLDAQGRLHGNLLLRGSGDPALVVEQVTQMMVRWRAAGLRHIDGDLVLDRSGFELPAHDPAAFDGESLKPYNAGPDALMLNQQAVTLRLAPSVLQPGQWQLSLEPELASVSVVHQLKVGMPRAGHGNTLSADCSGDWREALQLVVAPRADAGAATEHGLRPWQLVVSGSLPLSCGNKDWPLLWQGDGPGDHAARVLLASWQALGGTLSGQVRQAKWPAELPVWQSWTSPPLTQVVRDINKFSNNVMARQLLLSLPVDPAASTPVSVNLGQARHALQAQVAQLTRDAQGRSPCAAPSWRVDNGSGLSREERSSAACLGRWVQAMWASPVMPEWLASLPLVGVDGTTRRWTGAAAGRAHIKTGSLDGVATMAGVVDGASGQRWAVVALGQHPQGGALRAWYAQVLGWLAQQ